MLSLDRLANGQSAFEASSLSIWACRGRAIIIRGDGNNGRREELLQKGATERLVGMLATLSVGCLSVAFARITTEVAETGISHFESTSEPALSMLN